MLRFNGALMPNFIKVQGIDIQSIPEITHDLRAFNGGVGCMLGKATLGAKKITVNITVVIPEGKSLQSCARELGAWVVGNNFRPSPLIILDDAEVQYQAVINSTVDLSDLIYAGSGAMEFIVPSGLAERVEPAVFTGENRVTVINGGSYSTYPTITATVNEAVSNGVIFFANETTGDKVLLYGTFNVGDIIEVNNSKYLVKHNDKVSSNIVGLKSTFFSMGIGENVVTCSTSASLNITIQERYI